MHLKYKGDNTSNTIPVQNVPRVAVENMRIRENACLQHRRAVTPEEEIHVDLPILVSRTKFVAKNSSSKGGANSISLQHAALKSPP
jgi:hypothetical protein